MTNSSSPVIFGSIADCKKDNYSWGTISTLFANWGWEHFVIDGFLLLVEKEIPYSEWGNATAENLCVVEAGAGSIIFNNKKHALKKGSIFKIFPDQSPLIVPESPLTLVSVQMPNSSVEKAKESGEDLANLKIIHTDDVPAMVYEYETLGQEIIKCGYANGLGIIKLTFPIDKIPLHRHPSSARLIWPISGQGYTYVHPELHELKPGGFSLFPKNVIHTNGPVPGSVFEVYAYHLPWVNTGIDEEHIAGDEKFVQYEGPQLPEKLWKTKADFYRVIKNLA